MADVFGCDPVVAGQASEQLAAIRREMQSLGSVFDGYDSAVRSARVERALDDFYSDSSDYREAMNGLLERASGLMRGLAEGSTSVDLALAGAFDSQDQQASGEPPTGPAR
ncbi:MAG: hypothetical protein GXX79_04820 [Actinomycetales bacterium]|nr:hypothetical protein [Actinomycetales bacterium]